MTWRFHRKVSYGGGVSTYAPPQLSWLDAAWHMLMYSDIDIDERAKNRMKSLSWLCRYARQDYLKMLDLPVDELNDLLTSVMYWCEEEMKAANPAQIASEL